MIKRRLQHFLLAFSATFAAGLSGHSFAASMDLGTSPLFVTQTVPPLTMLVMGRDHKLYYEAYNDATDLNEDGIVDVGYQGYHGTATDATTGKLLNVDYFGYFNSYVCYDYNSSTNRFEPASAKSATDIANKDKTCSGVSGDWSGDFLNYVTTARIDAMRKVFYGGYRETDTSSQTVLERTHIPQDAHAWGKEYKNVARDGYDISDYTPLSIPAADTYHLFANVSLENTSSPYGSMSSAATPRLRVLNDTEFRVWEWLSKERPVAGDECTQLGGTARVSCEAAASGWSIVPDSVFTSLTRSTYDISGYSGHPSNNSDFDTLETNYATNTNLFGTDNPSQINGSGNPHDSQQDNYMTIFEGTIEVSQTGNYEFAVDGDDAVEVIITVGVSDYIVGWYGPHGRNNSDSNLNTYSMTVPLNANTSYNIKFRMEEAGGQDNYYLYWKDPRPASTIDDYDVRVEVCNGIDSTVSHSTNSCTLYPNGNYKPTGLLHEFGEDDSMMFGLLTGSYEKNLDGGVLRKAVSSFKDEVNSNTGEFLRPSESIVDTLDRLKTVNFSDSSRSYSCGWINNRPIRSGECDMWGNPVAEMMYESLRYFAGKGSPTSDFDIASSGNNDAALGLPKASWDDPYDATNGYDECAAPFQVVVSDINPSYDSDKIPGVDSNFSTGFTGDVSGLDVSALADTITTGEGNIAGNSFFVGQSGSVSDNAPTAKTVASLASIRGMAPEEPTKLGSYYSASLAYYGLINDVNTRASDQNLQTFAVALASPLPTIEIDTDNNPATDNSIVIVPFAKSVGNGSSDWTSPSRFNPTNQIVDFYVESLGPTSGSFLINYEDVEQGADHDMDAISRYTYTLNADGTVTIDVDSLYAAGSYHQHMGYVISGTTQDGVYLEVRDQGSASLVYPLDTPPGVWAGDPRGSDVLGLNASRTFTPSNSGSTASFLKDPLWYAAKWGGFIEDDQTANNQPDLQSEWDTKPVGAPDGNPDNYFKVTNALKLKDRMEAAFDEILSRTGSSSTVTVSSGSLNTDTLLFQAKFVTDGWVGLVEAIDFSSGSVGNAHWEFSEQLRDQLNSATAYDTNREIITFNTSSEKGVPFRFPATYSSPLANSEISSDQVNDLLDGVSSDQQDFGEDLVNYLRGDETNEQGARQFRERGSGSSRNVLGDIVHSDPLFVIAPGFFYSDTWPTTINGSSASAPENAATQKYSDFRSLLKTRKPVLYVGANDGMLHAINAYKNGSGVTDGGEEILGYVPGEIYEKLPELADPTYSHEYFVDGKTTYADAFFSSDSKWHTTLVGTLHGGGQGLFALDITDPHGIASGSGYPSFDESYADDLVLWEFTDEDDADLGYTFGRPTIVRLANGKWGAIFGNGYDNIESDGTVSTTGNASVFIVDIETGAVIKKFDTEQGTADDPASSGRPNGMSEAAPVDIDGDFVADYIYAGDLFGNLWKIDISDPNDANWGFSFTSSGSPAPLYVARSPDGDRVPITQRPQIGSHPLYGYDGDVMVYFGTGKYVENNDNSVVSEETQSFFGIWDYGDNTHTRSDLLAQSIVDQGTGAVKTGPSSTKDVQYREVSNNPIRWEDQVDSGGTVTAAKHEGWVLDLINTGAASPDNEGERSVNSAVLRDGRLTFTTLVPSSDPCDGGGSGWVMTVDAEDGSQLDFSNVDLNEDGKFDNADLIDTDGDGVYDVIASGTGGDGEIPSNVASVDDPGDDTTKNVVGKSDGTIEVFDSPLDALVNKRLYWRELK